jgi:hypothetical protein
MKTTITTPDGYTIQISTRRAPAKVQSRRSPKPQPARRSRPKQPRERQLTLPW